MIGKLLIANRGEIAARIMRTARCMGIRTVAVYSDADASALHVAMADEAIRIVPPPASQSYLDQAAILAAAIRTGADAIHPGYGFLAENPDFAEAVANAGLVFVGPPPAAIRAMGLKDEARRLMQKAGVPLLPGYDGAAQDAATLANEAARIGFPILVKPVAGGGGKGMRRVNSTVELSVELAASRRESISAFGNGGLLLEKFVERARHIEVQIMADAHGNIVHLFERDCSLQRRHQKVIEETPAPGMTAALRERLCAAAITAARSVGYVGAGTVEFLVDASEGLAPGRFYFMEMNTRLQVEHPVTEMVTGLDLVELQLRVAVGEPLPIAQGDIRLDGHAIEARLYAEDPARGFQPQTGLIARFSFPQSPALRIDSGVREGDRVQHYYDPMLAKLIVHAPTRREALSRLTTALAHGEIAGCRTNLDFLNRLLRHPAVVAGDVETGLITRDLEALVAAPELPIEVIATGLLFACGHLSPPRTASPFDTLAGFRLWGGETWAQTFMVGGTPLTCRLEFDDGQFIAHGPAQSLRFRLMSRSEAALRLDCGDRVVALWYFHHDAELAVAWGETRFELGLEQEAAASTAGDGGGLIVSPMPGLLRSVLVVVGDVVELGATVAIVEAMKMELSLKADRGGRVTKVEAQEGTQITEGTVLLRIGDIDD